MRNTLKNMAEVTYAKLTQGRKSTRLPHTLKFMPLKSVVISALHKIDKPGADPGFLDRGFKLAEGVRFVQFDQFFLKFPMKMK